MNEIFVKFSYNEEEIYMRFNSLRGYSLFVYNFLNELKVKTFEFYVEGDILENFVSSISEKINYKEIIKENLLEFFLFFCFNEIKKKFEDYEPFIKGTSVKLVFQKNLKVKDIVKTSIIFKNIPGIEDVIFYILSKASSVTRKIEKNKNTFSLSFICNLYFETDDLLIEVSHDNYLRVSLKNFERYRINQLISIIYKIFEKNNFLIIENE